LDFTTAEARAAWAAIRNLEAANAPIDLTTVADELTAQGKSDERWVAYLGICATAVPTTDHALEYARRVKDYSLRRRVLEGLAELLGRARVDPDLRGSD